MTRNQIIKYVLILAGIIAAIAITLTILKGISRIFQSRDQSNIQLVGKLIDQAFAAKQEVIELTKKQNELLWKINADLVKKDSVMEANYQQHQQVYTKLNEKLKNVPVRIARISGNDDSIRSAFANY